MAKRKKKIEIIEDAHTNPERLSGDMRLNEDLVTVEKGHVQESIPTIKKRIPLIKKEFERKTSEDDSPYGIYTYIGGTSQFTIDGITFDRWVPTYVSGSVREKCKKLNIFEKYSKSSKYSSIGRPILIYLPIKLEYVIQSINALHKVKASFPTCPIFVSVHPTYKSLLPGFCKIVTNARGRYYREFDLRESKLSAYWLAPINLSVTAAHSLISDATGLYSGPSPRDMEPAKLPIKCEKTMDCLFIVNGDTDFVKHVYKYMANENLFKFVMVDDVTIDMVKEAKTVVVMSECNHALVAGYFEIPTLLFLDPSIEHRENDYKAYGITVYPFPIEEDFETAIQLIERHIGG